MKKIEWLKIEKDSSSEVLNKYKLMTKDNDLVDYFKLEKKEAVTNLAETTRMILGMKDNSYEEHMKLLDMYLEKPKKYKYRLKGVLQYSGWLNYDLSKNCLVIDTEEDDNEYFKGRFTDEEINDLINAQHENDRIDLRAFEKIEVK